MHKYQQKQVEILRTFLGK